VFFVYILKTIHR